MSDASGVRLSDVRVAIVTWNSAEVIGACVDSLLANGLEGSQITVVDHGSADDTLASVRRSAPEARCLVLPENRSYGGAINHAAAEAGGRWLLVVNPDTEMGKGSVRQMLETLAAHPETAVVVPSVLDREGVNRTRIRRMSMLRACVFLSRHRWSDRDRSRADASWIAGRHQQWTLGQRSAQGPEPLTFTEGCCLLIRRQAFDLVGGFDEDYTFFYEDADLSLRFRSLEYLLLWDPAAEVRHVGGHSFSRVPDERLAMMLKGMLLFYAKHARRRYVWWRRIILAQCLLGSLSRHHRGREWWSAFRRDVAGERYLPDGARSARPVEPGLVSVIIPTYRRPASLRRLLEALAKQTYRACEIIIVDQSPETFRGVPPGMPFPVTMLRSEVPNRSIAKNSGARIARGEWLLFMDDDVVPDEHLVAAHVSAFRARPVAGVSCRLVETGEEDRSRLGKLRITSFGRIVTGFDARGSEPVGMLVGGNMSFRADRFRQSTGFDGSLAGTSIMEEPEVCEQIAHRGGTFWFSDKSVVRHEPQPDGNADARKRDPAQYYWSVHRNLMLLFLRHRDRWQIPGLVVWSILRSIRQGLVLRAGGKGVLRMIAGLRAGAHRYYRSLQ
ncbi:MAG: glycosyltransferase [Bacteroidetes bacterium]|jgi:N-acetylglucosaminyl-diphospho-decaprenol L-rhamnosyltransferase|nr:glycosyltransferase [Bacteroidota bacterium]